MRRCPIRFLVWSLLPLGWVALALIASMQPANMISDNGKVEPIPFSNIFIDNLRHYFWWMVLTPLVVCLVRRANFVPGRLLRAALLHALVSVPVCMLFITLRTSPLGLSRLWYQWPPSWNNYRTMLSGALGVFALITVATIAFDTLRRYIDKQKEAAELEAQLSKAQLSMLRMQLEPHFLFNTLNTISSLVDTRPADARRMITLVGELLRDSLEARATVTQPLEEELDWIERYLEIQQVRFKDRLHVRMEIEPAALRVSVPTLILQPLVENAIKHGLEPIAECVTLDINARTDDEKVIIAVRDDGAGLLSAKPAERIGLSNTRQRLQTMYKAGALQVRARADRGVESIIEIPING